MDNNSKYITDALSLKKRNSYETENNYKTDKISLSKVMTRVYHKNEYPLKIRKLCGSKKIRKNTLSLLPMEYISPEEEDNSVLTAKIAESIKCRGMLLPIVVYKAGKNNFKIIDGRRRYLAAKMLEQKYIECLILNCTEELAAAMRAASQMDKLCTDKISIIENYYTQYIISGSTQIINEFLPNIENSYIAVLLTNLGRLEKEELKLLRKIDIQDTITKIITVDDKIKRQYAEQAAAEMIEDYKSLIEKAISDATIKPQKNEKLVIKNSIFLFNSLDSLVKKLTSDKLSVEVTKDLSPDNCEYILRIKQK